MRYTKKQKIQKLYDDLKDMITENDLHIKKYGRPISENYERQMYDVVQSIKYLKEKKNFNKNIKNPLYGGSKAATSHVKRLVKYIKGYTGRQLSLHEGQEVYALLIHHHNDWKREGVKANKSLENKVIKDYIDDLKRRGKKVTEKDYIKGMMKAKIPVLKKACVKVPFKKHYRSIKAKIIRAKNTVAKEISKIENMNEKNRIVKKYAPAKRFTQAAPGVKAVVLDSSSIPEFYDRFIKKNPSKYDYPRTMYKNKADEKKDLKRRAKLWKGKTGPFAWTPNDREKRY